MRVIAKRTLKEFWTAYRDSEDALIEWHDIVSKARFQNPNEVRAIFPSADQVGRNRIVFNICRNKYRLIAIFRYKIQMVYIRFVGTHKNYDRIKNIKEI